MWCFLGGLRNTTFQFAPGDILILAYPTISLRDPTDLRTWLGQYEDTAIDKRARLAYRWNSYSDGLSRGYPKGRRTEMWDAGGHTVWQYDAFGRVIQEQRYLDGKVYSTSGTYDRADRVSSMTFPDGETVDYVYEDQPWLCRLAIRNDRDLVGKADDRVVYNALGLPTAVRLPYDANTPNLYLRYGYQGSNLDNTSPAYPYGALWELRLARGDNLLRRQHFYDQAANPTRVLEDGGEDLRYEYDHLDRLLARKLTGAMDNLETFTYSPEAPFMWHENCTPLAETR